jgi:hypothetical protein
VEKEIEEGEMAGGLGLAALAITVADEHATHGPSLHRRRLRHERTGRGMRVC